MRASVSWRRQLQSCSAIPWRTLCRRIAGLTGGNGLRHRLCAIQIRLGDLQVAESRMGLRQQVPDVLGSRAILFLLDSVTSRLQLRHGVLVQTGTQQHRAERTPCAGPRFPRGEGNRRERQQAVPNPSLAGNSVSASSTRTPP